MFIQATRKKYRFSSTTHNNLTVEDLWDLSLKQLDKIAVAQSKKVEQTSESFLVARSTKDTEAKAKLELVLHIMDVKLAEQDAATQRHADSAELQELLAIKAEREQATLKGISDEDLDARINALK